MSKMDTLLVAANVTSLIETYKIGSHMGKLKTLLGTAKSLPESIPWQIFVGSPTRSTVSAKEDDMVQTKSHVSESNKRIFVHSPYLINLCTPVDEVNEGWHMTLLKKNLEIARKSGFLGVVVHVGKSTKRAESAALETMRKNILEALDSATPECPLILETPAGQGTELLTTPKQFLEFVKSIGDPRLKICIDTCHVFAAGHDPLDYLKATDTELIRLIHFNDSKTSCGSCKDLHAHVGTGHIGFEKMRQIAEYCHENNLPMVIE